MLSPRRTIYEKLASAFTEEQAVLYNQRVEEISPNIRYCAYNIGEGLRRAPVGAGGPSPKRWDCQSGQLRIAGGRALLGFHSASPEPHELRARTGVTAHAGAGRAPSCRS